MLKSLDLGYLISKSYFCEDGTQNYLVFQPALMYPTPINTDNWITGWKS